MGTIFKRDHKYKNAAGETVTKQGKTYWIKYYRNGHAFRESTESTSYDHARKLLALREGHIVENKFHGLDATRTTYDELEKDMLNDYQINGKKSTRRLASLFSHLRKKFTGMKASDITSDMIMEYIIARQKQKKENGTINRELSALRRMFNLGAQKTPPKVTQIPYFPMLKEALPREGFFEYPEYIKLHAVLPDHVKPIFTVGYYTGMRKGEILKIKWGQVDLDAGKITLSARTTKTSKQRIIYLAGELYQVFYRQYELSMQHPNCEYVFNLNGEQLNQFIKSWKSACKKAGMEGKLFHDLRRSGVRNMTRSGISESVAMRISGHKTRSVFDRYNITSEEDLKTAAEKVTQYQSMMKEKLEQKQREVVTGTGIGTGNAFEGENQAFLDSKTLK